MTTNLPLTFFVAGVPKPQPRARGRHVITKDGREFTTVYNPSSNADWKRLIALELGRRWSGMPVKGPLVLSLKFLFGRPKTHYRRCGNLKPDAPLLCESHGDFDNLAKAVADVMQSRSVFVNDKQIVRATILKVYGVRPGVGVHLRGAENSDAD